MVIIGPGKKKEQVQLLRSLFVDLIHCVRKPDIAIMAADMDKYSMGVMNLGGRVERINRRFVRKWGNKFVKYWKSLADLRAMPGERAREMYHRKQVVILKEAEFLVIDLQIDGTVGMRDMINGLVHNESLHDEVYNQVMYGYYPDYLLALTE